MIGPGRSTILHKYRRLFAVSTSACLAMMQPVGTASARQSCTGSKEIEKTAIDIRRYFDSEGLSGSEYEYVEDELTRLMRSPLDLNSVSPETLGAVPGISTQDVIAFTAFKGRLESLSDLDDIESLSPSAINILRLVGCVVDISDNTGAASERSFSIRIRNDRRWDSRDSEGDVPSAGSPVRSYVRLRTTTGRNAVSISFQKDAYERFIWNPGAGWYGYDHIAGYVNWRSKGNNVSIVAGDYTVALGQGLVLSRPFGSRISRDTPWRVLRSGTGARGYSGSYEAFAFRGVAIGMRPAEGYSIHVFYSRRHFDARPVGEADSPGTVGGFATYKLSSTGTHVSPDQVRYRNVIAGQSSGAAVVGTFAWMRIGALLALSRFGAPLILHGSSAARESTLDGSLFWELTGKGISMAGEVAALRLSGIGLIAGAVFRPARQLDLAIVYRHYPSGGSGLRGQPFGLRRSLGPQNGLYLSWTVRQPKKWSVSASLDMVAGSNAALPATYRDVRLTFTLSPGESIQVLSQLKFRNIEAAGKRADLSGSILRNIDAEYFRQLSLQVLYSGHGLALRTRFDMNTSERRFQAPSTGIHAYQVVSIRLSRLLEVVIHHAFFEADSYENRFYIYEKDVTGKFSVPVLTASGTRSAVVITSRLGRAVKIELKYVLMAGVSKYPVKKGTELPTAPRQMRSLTIQLSVDI